MATAKPAKTASTGESSTKKGATRRKTSAASTTKKPAAAKKTAAPKASTKKKTAAAAPAAPEHEDIQRLAYQLWEERGRPEGSGEEDWNRAFEILTKG